MDNQSLKLVEHNNSTIYGRIHDDESQMQGETKSNRRRAKKRDKWKCSLAKLTEQR